MGSLHADRAQFGASSVITLAWEKGIHIGRQTICLAILS